MGGRNDRGGLLGEIEAGLEARRVDVREAFGEVAFGDLRGIQQHVRGAVALHHRVDGPGDDIARRKVSQGVEVLHERPHREIAQDGAFSADGLGDEGAAAVGRLERGRMELDHLHVAHFGAGAIGHRDAIAGRDIRIRRELIDLAGPAGGEDDGIGGNRLDASGLGVEDVETEDTVIGRTDRAGAEFGSGDQVDRKVVLEHHDFGRAGDGAEQGGFDGATGHVAGMEDASLGMAAFTAEVGPAIRAVLEFHAPGDEFGDPGGA